MADVPEWVRRQRKIAKMGLPFETGYFTRAMLDHPCRLVRGIKGIDPDGTDKERASDEAAWFTAHPVMTAEMREKRRVIGQKNKGFISGNGNKKTLLEAGLDEVHGKKGRS